MLKYCCPVILSTTGILSKGDNARANVSVWGGSHANAVRELHVPEGTPTFSNLGGKNYGTLLHADQSGWGLESHALMTKKQSMNSEPAVMRSDKLDRVSLPKRQSSVWSRGSMIRSGKSLAELSSGVAARAASGPPCAGGTFCLTKVTPHEDASRTEYRVTERCVSPINGTSKTSIAGRRCRISNITFISPSLVPPGHRDTSENPARQPAPQHRRNCQPTAGMQAQSLEKLKLLCVIITNDRSYDKKEKYIKIGWYASQHEEKQDNSE